MGLSCFLYYRLCEYIFGENTTTGIHLEITGIIVLDNPTFSIPQTLSRATRSINHDDDDGPTSSSLPDLFSTPRRLSTQGVHFEISLFHSKDHEQPFAFDLDAGDHPA